MPRRAVLEGVALLVGLKLLPVDALQRRVERPALQHGVQHERQQLRIGDLAHRPPALLHEQPHLLQVAAARGEGERRAPRAVLGREQRRRLAPREHPAERLVRSRVDGHVREGPPIRVLGERPEPPLQPRIAVQVPLGLERCAEPQCRTEAREGLVAAYAQTHDRLLAKVGAELAAAVAWRQQLAVRGARGAVDAEDPAAVPTVVSAEREAKFSAAAPAGLHRVVGLPGSEEEVLGRRGRLSVGPGHGSAEQSQRRNPLREVATWFAPSLLLARGAARRRRAARRHQAGLRPAGAG